MPRTVDHAERRAQIIEGLVRLAGREGLHAVTMRGVAAEAGVSLRLVQYYFQGKGPLVLAALRHLERLSHERWHARLESVRGETRGTGQREVPARAVLESFLEEALPTDELSRVFHQLWVSCAALAMTDPHLAEQPFVAGPDRVERELADVLERARTSGELPAGCDVAAEAARLLVLHHGLGTSVLVAQRTPEAARELLRYHLDRLFGGEAEQSDS